MFYLIIEFMKGSLPWSNIENKEVPHLPFLLCLTCSSQTALLARLLCLRQPACSLALLAVFQTALLALMLSCLLLSVHIQLVVASSERIWHLTCGCGQDVGRRKIELDTPSLVEGLPAEMGQLH